MELGKRVRVTKGEHRDDYGTIRQMVGNGHGRRWVVQFDNDLEIPFHAKSLEVQDDYDDSGAEEEGKNDDDEVDEAGNDHAQAAVPLDDDIPPPAQEDEFDPDWILQARAAM